MIDAVAGKDKAAFSVLFTYFAPRVKGMLMRSGFDAARAEEVAQETLLTVWHKAAMFDPAGASASAWIYTIARNLRIDVAAAGPARQSDVRCRRIANRNRLKLRRLSTTCPRRRRCELRVRDALVGLSKEQRDVVILSFFESKAHPEIAEALGIPLGQSNHGFGWP